MGAMGTSGQLQVPAAFPLGKSPLYPLYRRLGGSQCPSGQREFEKNVLPLPEIEPRPSSPQPVAIPTELYQLLLLLQIQTIKKR
jgi:hypothetical protein